ncbi:MAG: CatA-like O-acetyltransferase [Pyrinomonadaceae bacterium]|nr:CatA-like O-acetyltransferase [Pyrinomonadaceae bacterium]
MFEKVDVENWARRDTFHFFRHFEDPFFNITSNVDVTRLFSLCKKENLSFSLAGLFASQQTLNSIPEFRLRFLDGDVVRFREVHATQTILNDDETFSFCYFENADDLRTYDRRGRESREKYLELKSFDVEADRIDLVYYSVIPWISFTSFKHASRQDRTQSVPRIVFGRVFEDAAAKRMPVSVEVHHALMDGVHVGKYFNGLQDRVNSPV